MRNRREIITKLIERDGACCSSCGQLLNPDNVDIDHIIPYAYGGTDELENLHLVCPQCNRLLGNKPLLGAQFEEYIKELLRNHLDYSDIHSSIKTKNGVIDADIIVNRKKGNKTDTIIAELKIATSYTSDRIVSIIESLVNYKRQCPFAKLAFVFPGELSKKYKYAFEKEGIEIWDRKYLANEFKEQIASQKSIFSKMLFYTIDDMSNSALTENKFIQKIDELKACPCGKEHWGNYQKIVGEIIEMLFFPELEAPISQSKDQYHKNRRDYIMPNYSTSNIWSFLREKYYADFIVIDAKNSGKAITKEDVLQIENYLKREGTGLFGIIIARKGLGQPAEYALREAWIHNKKMIVVLNDDDIEQMLLDKKNGNDPAKIIRKKIEDFRLLI